MSKVQNKPNAEQQAEFSQYIKNWQSFLNLNDWRIEPGKRPAVNAMASVECNSNARLATYRIGDFGASEINSESLSMTALHECLHVFLYDLITVCQDRTATPDQLEVVEHRVINVLERLLYRSFDGSANSH